MEDGDSDTETADCYGTDFSDDVDPNSDAKARHSGIGNRIQGTEPPMGTGDGDDPRSPANRGWRRGWTPDPRQIGDGGGDDPRL
jgi:hypothetical protein